MPRIGQGDAFEDELALPDLDAARRKAFARVHGRPKRPALKTL